MFSSTHTLPLRALNLVDHSQGDVRVRDAKLLDSVDKRQHQPAYALKIVTRGFVHQAVTDIHDAA